MQDTQPAKGTHAQSTAGASAQKATASAGARLGADTDDDASDEQPGNPNAAASRPGQMADAGFAGGTTAQADAFEGPGVLGRKPGQHDA